MQWTKHKSITAVFAISAAAAAAWFAFVSFDRAGAFDEKPESGWIHEECDYTDYYFNQHLNDGGVCTHDLSYTEPAIPVGSYYPDGDASADHYMEVSFEDGKYYMTYKSPDGSLYGDEASEYYGKSSLSFIPFIQTTVWSYALSGMTGHQLMMDFLRDCGRAKRSLWTALSKALFLTMTAQSISSPMIWAQDIISRMFGMGYI